MARLHFPDGVVSVTAGREGNKVTLFVMAGGDVASIQIPAMQVEKIINALEQARDTIGHRNMVEKRQ